jgi:hypothetical protein
MIDIRFTADIPGTYELYSLGSGIRYGGNKYEASEAGPTGGQFFSTTVLSIADKGNLFFGHVIHPNGRNISTMCTVNN